MKGNINEIQIDALKEANNIGAGHAAMALSQMLNKKIMIAVTRSEVVPSEIFLKNILGDKTALVASVYLKSLGDIQGAVIFMFKKESALKLSDLLLCREDGETKFIDEKAQSAIKEVNSILTGAFFSVLADMFNLKVFHKTPFYAFDKAEVIMDSVCEEAFGDREERLCLATEFIESSSKITGSFAFIPTQEAMEKLLKQLKVK
ncbi:MAG: chemotaxis protein CheC [Candidatus Omnitrophica bacterium]|nr:chemotaxis protein CheC [Candidatus Omnitrophota bacterium]